MGKQGERFGPGDRVGDLEIERELGRGAFGSVYLARDRLLGRPVALKVFDDDEELDDRERERLLDEARLVGRLKSPHVVTLYHVHPAGDRGWMFEMEFVAGGTLGELLQKRKVLPVDEALKILKGIARGLSAAHEAGILHGDVKPANVLLDRDGTAKIADFGLARLLQDPSLAVSQRGEPAGTPLYMAPEVVMGEQPGRAADFWGFGIVMHRMLTGRLPFQEENWNALFVAIQNAPPPPLGPEVPRAIESLAVRCLAKDPGERPATFEGVLETLAAVEQSTAQRVTPAPLDTPAGAVYGRQRERKWLYERVTRAKAGDGTAVLVTGHAGIGKTATMSDVAEYARARGFNWIEMHINPVEGLLRPLMQELRHHAVGISERFGASAQMLTRFLRSDAPQLESRRQLVWAVERILLGIAAERPLGLLVEDAHEAGVEELHMLAELAARLKTQPVFLAITFRRQELDAPRLHELGDMFERLELQPLESDAVQRVMEDVVRGARVTATVAQRVIGLADGNALFARELMLHLLEQGAVVRRGNSIEPGGMWGKQELPNRIRSLVTHRLHGLGEEPRAMLDVAAVDGLEFDGEAVAAVLDMPLLKVLRSLQLLYRERGLVTPKPTGYRFSHPLIRETIRDEAAPAMRREIHRRLAEHLEERDEIDPERIGTHWEHGGDLERARPPLIAAATAAGQRQEMARAIDLCERAGLVAGRIDQETLIEHAPMLALFAICLADTKRLEQADAIFDALIDAAEATGNEELRLTALIRRGRCMYPFEGTKAFDEAVLRRAVEVLDGVELGVAHYDLGILAKFRGDWDQAMQQFRDADSIYSSLDYDAGHADSLGQMGVLARRAGHYEDAARLYAESAEVSRRSGRQMNAAVQEVNLALVGLDRGRFDGLEATLERAIRTLEREGARDWADHARIILAGVHFARGEVESAGACVALALRKMKSAPGRQSAHLLAADLAMVCGDLDEAGKSLRDVRRIAEQSGIAKDVMLASACESQRRLLSGDPEGAAEAAREALDLAAEKSSVADRSEVVLRLAESVLYGLDVDVLQHPAVDEQELPETVRTVVEGCRALKSSEGRPQALHAAGAALASPRIGERAAVYKVAGHWLHATALHREKNASAAQAEALRALQGAEQLGYLGQQLGLLEVLYAWTGEEAYEARRRRLAR